MYSTFQAFRPHFDALARVAYFKIVPKPTSQLKRSLHDGYRVFVWILVITYNLQHVIQVIRVRHSMEKVVDTLFVLLTTLNTMGKQIAFNARSGRIDLLIATIAGPLFESRNDYHVTVMKRNALDMSRLLKLYHSAIYVCGIMFGIFPLVNRIIYEKVQLSGYFPFDTDGTIIFTVVVVFHTIVLTIQGYGNVTLDCTIVAFFAQSQVQLQMLQYDLEHLVDSVAPENENNMQKNILSTTFKDDDPMFEQVLKKRLRNCVERLKLIIWFTNEVEAVFGEAMVVQFFVMAWVICMTLYKMSGLSLLSAETVSMAMYLVCMLAQLFIYCFYGTQVKYESEFINSSLYSSEWTALSPRARRLLLVAMQRGARAIAPRTAYIIPMSLDTYIACRVRLALHAHGCRYSPDTIASVNTWTALKVEKKAKTATSVAHSSRALAAVVATVLSLSTTVRRMLNSERCWEEMASSCQDVLEVLRSSYTLFTVLEQRK